MAKDTTNIEQITAVGQKPEIGGRVLDVDLEASGDGETYYATTSFTTLVRTGDDYTNAQIQAGETVDATRIPQVWIDQAVGQRLLLPESYSKKFTAEELVELGFSLNALRNKLAGKK